MTARERVEWRSWLSAPRWAGAADWLDKMAMLYGVDVDVRERKRLIRTTVYFTVRGSQPAVANFVCAVSRTIAEWNA